MKKMKRFLVNLSRNKNNYCTAVIMAIGIVSLVLLITFNFARLYTEWVFFCIFSLLSVDILDAIGKCDDDTIRKNNLLWIICSSKMPVWWSIMIIVAFIAESINDIYFRILLVILIFALSGEIAKGINQYAKKKIH